MDAKKKIKILLLIALFCLPAAATLIHTKVHPQIWWLKYLTLFDAIVITLLFYWKRTVSYAFFLNTTLLIIGFAAHLKFKWGGVSDNLIGITDFCLGYLLYLTDKES